MQLFYPLNSISGNIGVPKYHQQEFNKSYIPITGCILSHILSCARLSSLEKIYYILVDSLSYINNQNGRNRSVSIPAKRWAKRLSCSKSEVFVLQKSLEDQGYFIISRDKNDKGQNKRNTITTTVPDKVFDDLKFEPNRFNLRGVHDTRADNNAQKKLDSIDSIFVPTLEGKRQYLDRTKMFIRVPYEFLKDVGEISSISATSKVILLYLYQAIYKSTLLGNKSNTCQNYNHLNNLGIAKQYEDTGSFVTTSQELQKGLKLHRNSISKSLRDLEDNNIISKKQFFVKDTEDYNSRASKSLWQISLLNVSLINPNDPQEQRDLAEQNNQAEHICQKQAVISDKIKVEYNNNKVLKSSKEWECTEYDPPCTDSGQLYNKKFLIKKKYSKDIDYIDANSGDLNNLTCNHNLNSKNLSEFNPPSKFLDKFSVTENFKEEELENEQSSFSSESYKNSSFSKDLEENHINKSQGSWGNSSPLPNSSTEHASRVIIDISVKERKGDKGHKSKSEEDIAPYKELRHFYPLSDKDISNLNFYAEREFSSNFVNQLLLKLYIKYPEKRFKNKFTFLSYMKKLLKNEKHQGPLVNHASFRFSCNINEEDKNMLYYERYLTEIENSLDTSKEMQIKKKIAGRFDTKLAYAILKQVSFKTNFDNSFVTAIIPINSNPTNQNSMNRNLDLSEDQIETLSQQLEAVYGKNGYYVEVVGDEEEVRKKAREEAIREEWEETPEKEKTKEALDTSDNSAKEKSTNTKERDNLSNTPTFAKISEGVPLSAIPKNNAWYHIRKELIEELGINTDKAWFSKVVAQESQDCSKTATITLTLPTRFMADWVRNNYSHVIRRLSERCGIKVVEYVCK